MEALKHNRYILFGVGVSIAIALVLGMIFFPAAEGQANGAPTWTPMPVAVQSEPTGTPVPLAQPTASYEAVSIHQVPVVKDREQLTLNLLARMERTLAERDAEIARLRAGHPVASAPVPAVAPAEAKPTPDRRRLSIWEDGNCWTPPDTQVLQLCGAAAGDGYVIRWLGVQGDSRGPEIPDSDYLAGRAGGHDRLVWAGHHPATGEHVSVNYWAGGHVLAVHAAGRLLFRIDRNHQVIE